MTDKEFLQWIYDRLIHVYKENKNYDYMHKLKEIIDKYPNWEYVDKLKQYKINFPNPENQN